MAVDVMTEIEIARPIDMVMALAMRRANRKDLASLEARLEVDGS